MSSPAWRTARRALAVIRGHWRDRPGDPQPLDAQGCTTCRSPWRGGGVGHRVHFYRAVAHLASGYPHRTQHLHFLPVDCAGALPAGAVGVFFVSVDPAVDHDVSPGAVD